MGYQMHRTLGEFKGFDQDPTDGAEAGGGRGEARGSNDPPR